MAEEMDDEDEELLLLRIKALKSTPRVNISVQFTSDSDNDASSSTDIRKIKHPDSKEDKNNRIKSGKTNSLDGKASGVGASEEDDETMLRQLALNSRRHSLDQPQTSNVVVLQKSNSVNETTIQIAKSSAESVSVQQVFLSRSRKESSAIQHDLISSTSEECSSSKRVKTSTQDEVDNIKQLCVSASIIKTRSSPSFETDFQNEGESSLSMKDFETKDNEESEEEFEGKGSGEEACAKESDEDGFDGEEQLPENKKSDLIIQSDRLSRRIVLIKGKSSPKKVDSAVMNGKSDVLPMKSRDGVKKKNSAKDGAKDNAKNPAKDFAKKSAKNGPKDGNRDVANEKDEAGEKRTVKGLEKVLVCQTQNDHAEKEITPSVKEGNQSKKVDPKTVNDDENMKKKTVSNRINVSSDSKGKRFVSRSSLLKERFLQTRLNSYSPSSPSESESNDEDDGDKTDGDKTDEAGGAEDHDEEKVSDEGDEKRFAERQSENEGDIPDEDECNKTDNNGENIDCGDKKDVNQEKTEDKKSDDLYNDDVLSLCASDGKDDLDISSTSQTITSTSSKVNDSLAVNRSSISTNGSFEKVESIALGLTDDTNDPSGLNIILDRYLNEVAENKKKGCHDLIDCKELVGKKLLGATKELSTGASADYKSASSGFLPSLIPDYSTDTDSDSVTYVNDPSASENEGLVKQKQNETNDGPGTSSGINGAGEVGDGKREDLKDVTCSVCLGPFENRSFLNSCFHSFCYMCIVQWSELSRLCPLCKTKYQSLIHSVNTDLDYETFDFPEILPEKEIMPVRREFNETMDDGRRFRYRSTMVDRDEWEARRLERERLEQEYLASRQQRRMKRRLKWSATRDMRNNVYKNKLQIKEVKQRGNPKVRDISPKFFQDNPALKHRLVPWLLRDLNVLLGSNDEESIRFVMSLILNLVSKISMKEDAFREQLRPFLFEQTDQFVVELVSFASSPYDIRGYDKFVKYTKPEDEVEITFAGHRAIEISDSEERPEEFNLFREVINAENRADNVQILDPINADVSEKEVTEEKEKEEEDASKEDEEETVDIPDVKIKVEDEDDQVPTTSDAKPDANDKSGEKIGDFESSDDDMSRQVRKKRERRSHSRKGKKKKRKKKRKHLESEDDHKKTRKSKKETQKRKRKETETESELPLSKEETFPSIGNFALKKEEKSDDGDNAVTNADVSNNITGKSKKEKMLTPTKSHHSSAHAQKKKREKRGESKDGKRKKNEEEKQKRKHRKKYKYIKEVKHKRKRLKSLNSSDENDDNEDEEKKTKSDSSKHRMKKTISKTVKHEVSKRSRSRKNSRSDSKDRKKAKKRRISSDDSDDENEKKEKHARSTMKRKITDNDKEEEESVKRKKKDHKKKREKSSKHNEDSSDDEDNKTKMKKVKKTKQKKHKHDKKDSKRSSTTKGDKELRTKIDNALSAIMETKTNSNLTSEDEDGDAFLNSKVVQDLLSRYKYHDKLDLIKDGGSYKTSAEVVQELLLIEKAITRRKEKKQKQIDIGSKSSLKNGASSSKTNGSHENGSGLSDKDAKKAEREKSFKVLIQELQEIEGRINTCRSSLQEKPTDMYQ